MKALREMARGVWKRSLAFVAAFVAVGALSYAVGACR